MVGEPVLVVDHDQLAPVGAGALDGMLRDLGEHHVDACRADQRGSLDQRRPCAHGGVRAGLIPQGQYDERCSVGLYGQGRAGDLVLGVVGTEHGAGERDGGVSGRGGQPAEQLRTFVHRHPLEEVVPT